MKIFFLLVSAAMCAVLVYALATGKLTKEVASQPWTYAGIGGFFAVSFYVRVDRLLGDTAQPFDAAFAGLTGFMALGILGALIASRFRLR